MMNPRKVEGIAKADWIGLPTVVRPRFSTPTALGLIGLMVIMAFITTVETVGDISA